MLRYFGIIILATSLSAYGSYMASSIKNSYILRCELIQLLKEIERTIKFGNMAVIDVIKNCKLEKLVKCGFCDEFNGGKSAKTVINSTLYQLYQKDREMLIDFFSRAGKTAYGDLELKNCRYFIDYFESTQSQYEKTILSKSLLYKKIGLIIGILTAIIFI